NSCESAFVEFELEAFGETAKPVAKADDFHVAGERRLADGANGGVKPGAVTACRDDADAFCHMGNLRFTIWDLREKFSRRKKRDATGHYPCVANAGTIYDLPLTRVDRKSQSPPKRRWRRVYSSRASKNCGLRKSGQNVCVTTSSV